MKRAWILGSFVIAACGAEAPATRPPLVIGTASTASALPPVPPPRDDGRLPRLAHPLRYALHLDIDPRKDTFSGSEEILVEVVEESPHVVLNARGLTVRRASISIGNTSVPLRTEARASHNALEPDELVLSADRILPRGRATIALEYDAPYGKTLAGLYRATDAGESYAFTQFESADARRAFPCFDEPGEKTPFDVKITAPAGMIAISNGAETSRAPSASGTTFTFATTAPVPTYLVAFTVGAFDVVEGPKTPTPIRFVTTKGRAAFATQALRDATDILPLLAKYFGVAYPYDKLDLVAVPDFGAGGMENAGLITFRDDAVLFDDHASARQKRNLLGLMTHELAHQWFGDLVTMKWWDDLWLNEGFATWATYKIVDAYKPALGSKIDAAASATYIMDADGLASARAIRQPVATVGQAMEAFDGITYQKGAAVLRMIEQHVGEDVFQRGVHAYLQAHAWGNATADDFLSAVDAAAGNKEASDIARSYLDRAGVPVVAIDSVDCGASATVHAHTERFAPLGVSFGASSAADWKVPFCAESSVRGAKAACTLLGASGTLAVSGACPLFANPDAVGYYRVSWPENAMGPLMKRIDGASPSTRVAALGDAWAQARAGKLDGTALLRDVLPAIDRETERHVIERMVSILGELSDLVDDATWPAFNAYVRARLAPHIARSERIGDAKLDEDQRLLRRTLAYAEVDLGEDLAFAKKLEPVAKAFRANEAVDPDYGQIANELVARTGDAAQLRHAVETATTPQAHAIALRAAAAVVDPAAVKAQLDWALSPAVKLQDVRGILWPLASRHRSRAIVLTYARDHWDALRAKLPGALARGLVGLAGYACTPEALADSRAFYTQKEATLEGADRLLSQALESASLCVALRGKLLPQLKTALVSSSGAGVPVRR